MNKVVIITLLTVLMELLVAQSKYYEGTISWGWIQASSDIIYTNDTTFVLGCGSYFDINSREKTNIVFSDDRLANYIVTNYGAEYGDFVRRDMIPTPSGFAISGWMNNGVAAPITNDTYDHQFLMEIDHEGNLLNFYDLRQFPYQGDAMCMHYYPETNTYYVGGEAFVSTMPTQMWLLKMTNGEVVWRNNYGTFNHRNAIRKLLSAPNGGVYVIGDVDVYPGFYFGNFFLAEINGDGILEWSNTYSIGYEDQCTDGIQTTDGGFLLSGGSNLPNVVNNNKKYPSLLLLDSLKEVLWSRIFFPENSGGGYIGKVFQEGDNFICIGGKRDAVGSYTKAFIMKIRGVDGEPLWTRLYDYGVSHDYFYNFTPVPQPLGGFVCVGRTEPESGANVYIVKTNCMGLLTLPEAEFIISQDPDSPSRFLFTNQSQYAYPDSIDGGYYVWNWGDASPPFICGQGYAPCTQDTLFHTYQAEGVYGVTLQAIVCNDTSTHTQTICLGISPNPQAAFSYEDTGGMIVFTNQSQNAYIAQGGYFTWDFGDGSPPVSQEHPTHTYEENGSYTVTLTLIVCQDTSIYTQIVDVQTVSLPPDPLKGEMRLIVYPNPAQNTLTFAFTEGLTPPSGVGGSEISLFSPTGQQVLHTSIPAGQISHSFSVAHLPVGVYFYVVEDGGAVLARGKVAIVR